MRKQAVLILILSLSLFALFPSVLLAPGDFSR